MRKKLIIVADDYGFSEAYTLGALKAYREGVVTVLSLMSNMDSAQFAVELAKREAPGACLVQHTNFVQGRPVSNPGDIPSLVDANGMFYRSNMWKAELPNDQKLVGDVVVDQEDCKKETLAQMERFRQLTGDYPIHFEGHSAMTGAVLGAFREVAMETGIHCMAMPEEVTATMRAAHELGFDRPCFLEILSRGAMAEDFLTDVFGILESPYEINVLHFHPGYLDAYLLDNTSLTVPRCRDLEALCDPRVRAWIMDNGIELVDFREIYQS